MIVEILRRYDHANGRRHAAENSVMPAQAGIQGWQRPRALSNHWRFSPTGQE